MWLEIVQNNRLFVSIFQNKLKNRYTEFARVYFRVSMIPDEMNAMHSVGRA